VFINSHTSVPELISEVQDKLSINRHKKCKLFDSGGGELSDDDLDCMNPEEPLFLSQGEPFSKNSSIAIYEQRHLLGKGGFGSVWLYTHKVTKKNVAIKFIEMSTIDSPEDINQLYSEIAMLLNLSHPNIVRLIDAFALKDKFSFVMEYCSGGELSKYVKKHGPLPEEVVQNIATQIGDALRYCHNSNIVHRDIKPQNILLASSKSEFIKIVDFGIAGMFAGNQGEPTNAWSLLYTPPEILNRRNSQANPAIDIWGMGCVIYYLLTGRNAFQTDSPKATSQRILKLDYDPLPPEVSDYWHKLIKGMLKLNPSKRWDLQKILQVLREGHAAEESDSDEEVKVQQTEKQTKFARRANTHLPKPPVRPPIKKKSYKK